MRRDLRGSPRATGPKHPSVNPKAAPARGAGRAGSQALALTSKLQSQTGSATSSPGNLKSAAHTPATPNHGSRRQALPLMSGTAAAAASGSITWSPGSSAFPLSEDRVAEGAEGRAALEGSAGFEG